jgi:hypothetical protein
METQQTFGLDKPFRNARSALRQLWASHQSISSTHFAVQEISLQFQHHHPPAGVNGEPLDPPNYRSSRDSLWSH